MKKLLLLLLMFSSCAPVYVPNIRNSPMFTKGGEFQASVQVGNGLDGQVALSLTKNIGMIGSYSYINRERLKEDDFHRHTFYEGGWGYFNNKEDVYVEVFAGFGKGEGTSTDSFLGLSGATGRYERYFIQPAIGYNKKAMHAAFVARFSVVDFTDYSYGGSTVAVNEDPKVFFEPAVVAKANAMDNHLFFTFQAGFSTRFSNDVYFDHRNFQISTGIGFRLGGVKTETVSR